MATAGDGRAPYDSGGAGGKFRKRPFRRSAQATPYDRPPTALRNNNPSLLTKLVDPASRLIHAGAHRLFGVFRKSLPPVPSQGSPEIYEEPQNVPREARPNHCTGVSEHSTDQGGNSASISAATGISELEQMLKQKTFTRSEIERLTALLHSRTTGSPEDVVRTGAKPPSTPSSLLRLEASTSGSLKKYGDERDNLHAAISTPVVSSRVFEEEIASPAELAKAYMGSRPTKVAPSVLRLSSQALRQDSTLPNNASGLPKTPITSIAPKTANSFRGLENGFMTPRSRGRSAMYSMARTPYSRPPSTLNQKGIRSDYGHVAALTPPQSAWGHEGSFGSNKTALKRRSSVLDDDIGSGGPLRRTRQKANLLSRGSSFSRDKRELGYNSFEQPETSTKKLLLMNEPEPETSKAAEENGYTSMHGSGYALVPTKSSQMATKILQQLERLSPKEKSYPGMKGKSPTILTSNMLHGQALRSLEKVDSPKFLPSSQDGQKSEGQKQVRLHDARQSTSQSKDKIEENGPRKFPVPRSMLTSMNGDSTGPSKDKAPIVTAADSTLKLPAEPPQKRRAFQMSAHEDSFELDDDIHANGHVSIPLAVNKKTETPSIANEDNAVPADVIQTPTPPEVPTISAPAEVTPVFPEVPKISAAAEVTPALPEVSNIPAQPELKGPVDAKSPPKTDFGFNGGSVSEKSTGFQFPTPPPSTTAAQPFVLPQSTSQMEKVAPQKESNAFPSFGETAEKALPFQFSANEPSEFKPNSYSDPKPLISTSLFSSAPKKEQVKLPVSNKDDEGNDQKSANMFEKANPLFPTIPAAASTSGIFSFGGYIKNSSTTTNETPASNPPIFSSSSSFPASATNANSPFNNNNGISSNATSTGSTAATTTAASNIFSTSAPAPVFSFGLASTAPAASMAAVTNATNEKEPKSNTSTSFAATTTGSSLFGFSSPAATSTANNQSQGSFFNAASGSQASTQPSATVTVSFQFGSSTPSIPSSTSGGSLFGSSAPAFGISSVAASSETKSGSSTSGTTTSMFSSTWQQPAFSSPPVFSFGASSTPTPAASTPPVVFGSSNTASSTGPSMFSFSTPGATNPSFPPPSQSPPVFGTPTSVFGTPTTASPNNDQMSMEDSMAEDSIQTPTPSPVSAFGPAPGFMFGSAIPTPTPAPAPAPFQFGGQPNQAAAQNPFQASGSVEFNTGGSFSLRSGGGDKSGRRIVRVKSKNRRK